MSNEPVDLQDIDTEPETQPTIPTIADLIPARVRSWIYALLPVALLTSAFVDLPGIAEKATLILAAAGFGVSYANVPRRV